ncbi:hypothetical protein MASR1M90_23870 [Desulfovibrionales bacterium]
MKKQYVTGAKLLAQGFGPDDLARAIDRGRVAGPVTIDGQPRTKESDPCLYCREQPNEPKRIYCKVAHGRECLDVRKLLTEALFPPEALEQVRTKLGKGDPLEGLSPEEIVQHCHDKGITDPFRIAKAIDERYTGSNRLTDIEIGDLLPAKPGKQIGAESVRKRGQRLRKGPPEENQKSA